MKPARISGIIATPARTAGSPDYNPAVTARAVTAGTHKGTPK